MVTLPLVGGYGDYVGVVVGAENIAKFYVWFG